MVQVGDTYTFKSDDAPASLGELYHGSRCFIKKIDHSRGKYAYFCFITSKLGYGTMPRWISLDALYYYTNCPNPNITLPKVIMTHRLVE